MGDLSDIEIGEWEDTEEERQRARRGGIACRDLMRAIAEIRRHRAAQTASAERVRAVVREAAAAVLERAGISEPHGSCDAESIADRVAAQLTAPHVCPAPYGLGPEDVGLIVDLARMFRECGGDRTSAVLDKILAAHRAPTPTIEPLPEVIGCGAVGCVSSIKKHLLPAGWLLLEGRWLCPRCKVVATSEAS